MTRLCSCHWSATPFALGFAHFSPRRSLISRRSMSLPSKCRRPSFRQRTEFATQSDRHRSSGLRRLALHITGVLKGDKLLKTRKQGTESFGFKCAQHPSLGPIPKLLKVGKLWI